MGKKADRHYRSQHDGNGKTNDCRDVAMDVSQGLAARLRRDVLTRDYGTDFLKRVADVNSTPEYIRRAVENPRDIRQ
jgi:hypothetical protein